ncbi:MAG: tyrosine-type recombinase/integrase [Thermoleophilaceae bacterium]|nr:tyrosine-type recombinase/integrase [Thermoleophilaceae bacterium]
MAKVSIEIIAPDKHRLRWREAGRHRSKTIKGSRRNAERQRADLEDLLAGGASTRSGEKSLQQVADEVFARRGFRWSDKTLSGYHWLWQTHIDPHLGRHRIGQLRPRMVEDWLSALEAAGVGRESQRKSLAFLRRLLKSAVEWEYLQRNVAEHVAMPKPSPRRVVRPLTPEQVERMRECALACGNQRDALIFSLLGYQGLRPGELFGLTIGALVGDELLIEQRVTLKLSSEGNVVRRIGQIEPSTKTRVNRSVTLHPLVAAELRSYLLRIGRPEPDQLIFPNAAGNPLSPSDYANWRRRRYNAAAQAAGRPDVTPYTMRHSSASLLLWSGRSISYVARQLGHSPAESMRDYQHVIDELEFADRVDVNTAIKNARQAVNDTKRRVEVA